MSAAVEINDFLCFVSSERALSANTRQAYEKDLEHFLNFCRRKGILLVTIELHSLRDYLATLRKQGLTSRSIARKLSALKQLYKFLMREGRIESDPVELLSVQVNEKRLPKHLSIDQIMSLIEAASGKSEADIRDRALLELWYATGARVTEMATLTISAIDWKDRVVKVKGKGNRSRLIPISQAALEWCLKYRDIRHEWLRRHDLKDVETFFLSSRGTGFTRQSVWRLVKKYAEKAGLGKDVWPHMIRHSFATHVLEGGADLRSVQELLGHRSIATTEIYTHLSIENLKLMQLKYHPRR